MMKVNKWTLGLAAVGLISLPAIVQAEEKLNPVQSLAQGTTIGGYVSASAQWNMGTGNANMPSYGFGSANNAAKADGFTVDAVVISIEKALDATDKWAAGYKVEFAVGQDANNFTGVQNGIKQAYAALRVPVGNGIDVKMGQFDTIIGYEGFNATSNPNYTRSYAFGMEPTTHQGVLATYQINKIIGVAGGVANTWGSNPTLKEWNTKAESFKAYMGAVTLTAPESLGFLAGSTLYGGVVSGLDTGIAQNATSLYAGATVNTPLKDLKAGFSFDYKFINQTKDTTENPGYQWAMAGYLSYQITEKMSIHSRTEWANNTPRLAGTTSFNPAGDTIGTDPYAKVFAQTVTLQYDLWKNVITRGEFRWDHNLEDVSRYGGSTAGSGDRGNAYLLALNVIYKF